MTKKGREFNEIYDLTAMRVLVESVKDCYGAIGVIHSLWKPLPGRFKDWVAMPKFNMYQALHTTVIGPEGRPLEIQIRTEEMHRHGRVRGGRALDLQGRRHRDGAPGGEDKVEWLQATSSTGSTRPKDPQEFVEALKVGPVRGRGVRLHAQGRGQVARRRGHAARLRLLGAHRRGPPLRGREGERQDRAAPLRAELGRHLRGADLEEGARPVARLALAGQDHARAVEDPRLVQARAPRGLGARAAARSCTRT